MPRANLVTADCAYAESWKMFDTVVDTVFNVESEMVSNGACWPPSELVGVAPVFK